MILVKKALLRPSQAPFQFVHVFDGLQDMIMSAGKSLVEDLQGLKKVAVGLGKVPLLLIHPPDVLVSRTDQRIGRRQDALPKLQSFLVVLPSGSVPLQAGVGVSDAFVGGGELPGVARRVFLEHVNRFGQGVQRGFVIVLGQMDFAEKAVHFADVRMIFAQEVLPESQSLSQLLETLVVVLAAQIRPAESESRVADGEQRFVEHSFVTLACLLVVSHAKEQLAQRVQVGFAVDLLLHRLENVFQLELLFVGQGQTNDEDLRAFLLAQLVDLEQRPERDQHFVFVLVSTHAADLGEDFGLLRQVDGDLEENARALGIVLRRLTSEGQGHRPSQTGGEKGVHREVVADIRRDQLQFFSLEHLAPVDEQRLFSFLLANEFRVFLADQRGHVAHEPAGGDQGLQILLTQGTVQHVTDRRLSRVPMKGIARLVGFLELVDDLHLVGVALAVRSKDAHEFLSIRSLLAHSKEHFDEQLKPEVRGIAGLQRVGEHGDQRVHRASQTKGIRLRDILQQ